MGLSMHPAMSVDLGWTRVTVENTEGMHVKCAKICMLRSQFRHVWTRLAEVDLCLSPYLTAVCVTSCDAHDRYFTSVVSLLHWLAQGCGG